MREILSLSNKKKKIILLIIILLFVGILGFSFTDKTPFLEKSGNILSIDTQSSIHFKVVYKNPIKNLFFNFNEPVTIEIQEGNRFVEQIQESENSFYLKSKGKTGRALVVFKTPKHEIKSRIHIIAEHHDIDLDGFPDVVELSTHTDRENFKNWFLSIAESQFYQLSHHFEPIHRHCSGLIVFSFKEALKVHNEKWHKRFPYLIRTQYQDVQKYNYPEVPLLGTKIFRNRSGYYKKSDLKKGYFSETADVKTLINYNLDFISKNHNDFESADIIFFLNDENTNMPYHSMIFQKEGNWLIYHTGPLDNKKEGEVRKVKLTTLMKHPDKKWHPAGDNPRFLGAYRFKIIK